MQLSFVLVALSFLTTQSFSASVDIWSSLLKERAAPKYETIEPEVIKARLGTTPDGKVEANREPGMVYFCREEN
ncbi:Tox1 [Fusarium beomiforme]|uniref:Tox1 n=1 Tax=Fusarium beomiforme TaxID=44412 RepID=A0A9P5DTX6_9HYPO|nr:Tox1 [Fusarium beomiforme]